MMDALKQEKARGVVVSSGVDGEREEERHGRPRGAPLRGAGEGRTRAAEAPRRHRAGRASDRPPMSADRRFVSCPGALPAIVPGVTVAAPHLSSTAPEGGR
jgi:hypothetical protein